MHLIEIAIMGILIIIIFWCVDESFLVTAELPAGRVVGSDSQ